MRVKPSSGFVFFTEHLPRPLWANLTLSAPKASKTTHPASTDSLSCSFSERPNSCWRCLKNHTRTQVVLSQCRTEHKQHKCSAAPPGWKSWEGADSSSFVAHLRTHLLGNPGQWLKRKVLLAWGRKQGWRLSWHLRQLQLLLPMLEAPAVWTTEVLQEGKSPTREVQGAEGRCCTSPGLCSAQLSSAIPNSLSALRAPGAASGAVCAVQGVSSAGEQTSAGTPRLFPAADCCFPSIPSSGHHPCICQHSSGKSTL